MTPFQGRAAKAATIFDLALLHQCHDTVGNVDAHFTEGPAIPAGIGQQTPPPRSIHLQAARCAGRARAGAAISAGLNPRPSGSPPRTRNVVRNPD